MASVRYRISIHSSPDQVFDVMTDFANYGRWNPWIKQIDGPVAAGSRLEVRFKLSTLRFPIKYTLVEMDPPDSFTWRGAGKLGLFAYSERKRQIYTRSDGTAIYSTRLQFFGPFASVAAWFYGRAVARGLRSEAQALKNYCEKNYPIDSIQAAPPASKVIRSVDLQSA